MALQDEEVVGATHLAFGVGKEFTGIDFGATAGVVDVRVLHSLLDKFAKISGEAEERADAIWIEEVHAVAGGTGSGSTAVIIPLAGPAAGRYYEITSVQVLGSDDHTTVANTAVVFCIGDPSNPSLTDCRIPGTSTIPASYEGGPHTFICKNPDRPYIKVYGLATDQPVVAIVNGWDRPLWADNERSLTGPLGVVPHSELSRKPVTRYATPDRPATVGERYDAPVLPREAGGWPPSRRNRRSAPDVATVPFAE